jgi:hypothetical protein
MFLESLPSSSINELMHVQNALFGFLCIFILLLYPMFRSKIVHRIHMHISHIIFIFYEYFVLQDLFVK